MLFKEGIPETISDISSFIDHYSGLSFTKYMYILKKDPSALRGVQQYAVMAATHWKRGL